MLFPTFAKKIYILLWKNHVTQWNNFYELIWLIISPALLCLLIVYMRCYYSAPQQVDIVYRSIDIDICWRELVGKLLKRRQMAVDVNSSFKHNIYIPQSIIAYSPNDIAKYGEIMDVTTKRLDPMKMLSFKTCEELRREMMKEHFFAGICFDPSDFKAANEKIYEDHTHYLTETGLPVHFNYSLVFPSEVRMFSDQFIGVGWITSTQDNSRETVVERLNKSYDGGYMGYVREGFITLQTVITETYLNMLRGPNNDKFDIPKIALRRFPVKYFNFDPISPIMEQGLAFLITIGFLFPAQTLVMQIVNEKQGDFRIYLYNLDVGNIPNFIAWFMKAIVYMMLSTVMIVVLLKIGWHEGYGIFTHTPWLLLTVILISYNTACATFCLMTSTFFTNAESVVRVTTIIWVFTYLMFLAWWIDPEKSAWMRYVICLFPNSLLGFLMVSLYELELIGYQGWKDMSYSLNIVIDRFTITEYIYIFLVMSLIYCLIGLYMEIWHAIDFSRAKRLLATSRDTDDIYSGSVVGEEGVAESELQDQLIQPIDVKHWINTTKIFEVEPTYKRYKIKTRKLCKRYGTRYALTDFTMNMYENEITVLMGHNGSGKTTLLRLIGGLIEPTRGTAIIGGHNIRLRRNHASRMIGMALNENILLGNLSAYNQIRFTCMLKGLNSAEARAEAIYYLDALNLNSKKNIPTYKLSLPERNLLMIACAFAGHSAVVLIDDLHADMDIQTQKLVWNFIRQEKQQRAVLLASSSSDPSDIISDRVAIIANGELKCTGTKPFLRNMYGHGYRLVCIKGEYCQTEELLTFMNIYMPTITVESDIGNRITFVLENKYEGVFSEMLDELERHLQQLDIVSCTLRETSMQEIFLHMGYQESDLIATTNIPKASILNYVQRVENNRGKIVAGLRLSSQHLRAYMRKRWIAGRRFFRMTVFNYIVLIVSTILGFITYLGTSMSQELTPLYFNLSQVSNMDAIIEYHGDENDERLLYDQFTDILFWYDTNVEEVTTKTTEELYLLQKTNISAFLHYKYYFGATFSLKEVTAWFNNIPLHSAPCSLNTVHNAIARLLHNDDISIDVTMDPLPYEIKIPKLPIAPITTGAFLGMILSFCFAFIWSGSAAYLTEERTSSFKAIQMMAGARSLTFWLATLFYDLLKLILMCISILLMTIFFLKFSIDVRMLIWIFVVLLIAGANVLALTYLLSLFFNNPHYAYIVIVYANTIGLVIFLSTLLVRDEYDSNLSNVLNLLSQYTMCECIFKIFIIFNLKERCDDPHVRFISVHIDQCKTLPYCCRKYSYWQNNQGIRFEVLSMCLTFAVKWTLLIAMEYRYFFKIRFCSWWLSYNNMNKKSELVDYNLRHARNSKFDIDPEVIDERNRVAKINYSDMRYYAIILKNVGKLSGPKRIINRVDLAIFRGESFGVLGLNSSGRSMLLHLMMGREYQSYGKIYILGHELHNFQKYIHKINFCPEGFNLPKEFTAREILEICAQLRGIKPLVAISICESLATMVGFMQFYNVTLSLCSSGILRRISIAIALLGDPKIVYVEGALTGIDPAGKRQVFNVITTMRKLGSTFVFTSLKATECEYMCSRIAILVNGQFWALGGMDHFQKLHGYGYLLVVRMKRQTTSHFSRRQWSRVYKERSIILPQVKFSMFMETEFPQSKLKEQQGDLMVFFIPMDSAQLSQIFYIIRRNAFSLNVEDFNITRNTIASFYEDLMTIEGTQSQRVANPVSQHE